MDSKELRAALETLAKGGARTCGPRHHKLARLQEELRKKTLRVKPTTKKGGKND